MTAKAPWPVPVAERGRRRGDDLAGTTRLSAVWDRLAPSARELASDVDGVGFCLRLLMDVIPSSGDRHT